MPAATAKKMTTKTRKKATAIFEPMPMPSQSTKIGASTMRGTELSSRSSGSTRSASASLRVASHAGTHRPAAAAEHQAPERLLQRRREVLVHRAAAELASERGGDGAGRAEEERI